MTGHLVHHFAHEHKALFLAILFCAWISISLIGRMWLRNRQASFLKKMGWSLILCVPLFGWLFYGGCCSRLGPKDARAASNPDAS
jgi:hypothetical protein